MTGQASTFIVETPRLGVRHLNERDEDALFEVYSDAEAMRWVGDGNPISRQETQRWIEVTLNNYATRGYGMNAILLKASQEIIGFCGLVHPGGQQDAEIKYALLRDYWGQGYASEVSQALIDFGFSKLKLAKIIATVAPLNHASQRVLIKAGLVQERIIDDDNGSQTLVFVGTAR